MKGARPLSPGEIKKVLRACKGPKAGRDQALVLLGLHLGLRVSELVGLRWRDVTRPGRTCSSKPPFSKCRRSRILPMVYLHGAFTKNNKSRAIPIKDKAAEALKILRPYNTEQGLEIRPQGYLFPGRFGGHLTERQVNGILYEVFDRAGLGGRLSSHTLCKTFGTILSERGVPLMVVKELLGHQNLGTTQAYLGVEMGSLREAVRGLSKAY